MVKCGLRMMSATIGPLTRMVDGSGAIRVDGHGYLPNRGDGHHTTMALGRVLMVDGAGCREATETIRQRRLVLSDMAMEGSAGCLLLLAKDQSGADLRWTAMAFATATKTTVMLFQLQLRMDSAAAH